MCIHVYLKFNSEKEKEKPTYMLLSYLQTSVYSHGLWLMILWGIL